MSKSVAEYKRDILDKAENFCQISYRFDKLEIIRKHRKLIFKIKLHAVFKYTGWGHALTFPYKMYHVNFNDVSFRKI